MKVEPLQADDRHHAAKLELFPGDDEAGSSSELSSAISRSVHIEPIRMPTDQKASPSPPVDKDAQIRKKELARRRSRGRWDRRRSGEKNPHGAIGENPDAEVPPGMKVEGLVDGPSLGDTKI